MTGAAPDVRAAIGELLAHSMLEARIAARDRYAAEVAGETSDADPITWRLITASGRTSALLELVAAPYGADQLGPMCSDARHAADRRDPDAAYVPRSPEEPLP